MLRTQGNTLGSNVVWMRRKNTGLIKTYCHHFEFSLQCHMIPSAGGAIGQQTNLSHFCYPEILTLSLCVTVLSYINDRNFCVCAPQKTIKCYMYSPFLKQCHRRLHSLPQISTYDQSKPSQKTRKMSEEMSERKWKKHKGGEIHGLYLTTQSER